MVAISRCPQIDRINEGHLDKDGNPTVSVCRCLWDAGHSGPHYFPVYRHFVMREGSWVEEK
jgi:hypothetical protein